MLVTAVGVSMLEGADAAILSGPVTNAANGHIYYLLNSYLTNSWLAADAEAVTLGGHLATINDAAEDAFVSQTFGPMAASLAWGRKGWLLTGLNDVTTEGSFGWVSGQPVQYVHWGSSQPDGGFPDEDGVGISVNYDPIGSWHDVCPDNRVGDMCFGVVEVPGLECSIRFSEVEVSWTSASNATYRVEYRSDLTTNNWVTLTNCVTSAGTESRIYDRVLQGQPQRYYRVVATNCVP